MSNSKFRILKIIQTIFAALIGVQRADKMQQDAANFKAYHFIIFGIIALIVFIILLISIVSYVT